MAVGAEGKPQLIDEEAQGMALKATTCPPLGRPLHDHATPAFGLLLEGDMFNL